MNKKNIMNRQNPTTTGRTKKKLQDKIFVRQSLLIIAMAIVMTLAGCAIYIVNEYHMEDQNLINTAESIANYYSAYTREENLKHVESDLDSLTKSLLDIDVISIVNKDGQRMYHTSHKLIYSKYEGAVPEFQENGYTAYAENAVGPSGTQRRAYAPIYTKTGDYYGFVIAVMLRKNLNEQIMNVVLVFLLIMLLAIILELSVSRRLSEGIKSTLLGNEPDSFTDMYLSRNEILESLQEGIVSIDADKNIRFCNRAAMEMIGESELSAYSATLLTDTLKSGTREMNVSEKLLSDMPVIVDRIPIIGEDEVEGAVAILHNRQEYTKLMEDLAGTRYLVDSMRANNHDFTNKLHVILGLLQMKEYEQAVSYIENITLVRQEIISKIMHAVDEPTIAALLIGKAVKASELNIKFTLQENSIYRYADYPLPQESLNTIIGNMIDNAFDAMNLERTDTVDKELLFGIHARANALLITVDDTGVGIPSENLSEIFQNGFSTKGENRGTGLYQCKQLIEGLGGTITVDSQVGTGTSITISFHSQNRVTRKD